MGRWNIVALTRSKKEISEIVAFQRDNNFVVKLADFRRVHALQQGHQSTL